MQSVQIAVAVVEALLICGNDNTLGSDEESEQGGELLHSVLADNHNIRLRSDQGHGRAARAREGRENTVGLKQENGRYVLLDGSC
jgi:hypothetical protein